jgi:orotate phosphoribosyltransferase
MSENNVSVIRGQLLELLKKEALKKGKFILSSGRESSFYLDGRIVTMLPQGAYCIARLVLEMVKGTGITALGGPTLGADPIVGAVAAVSFDQKTPLRTFIVRKATKGHGTQRQVEGPALSKGDRVVIVDDVATSGTSLIEAKEVLDGMGVVVVKAIVIVDRCEGARENLAQAGITLESIFTISDLGV